MVLAGASSDGHTHVVVHAKVRGVPPDTIAVKPGNDQEGRDVLPQRS